MESSFMSTMRRPIFCEDDGDLEATVSAKACFELKPIRRRSYRAFSPSTVSHSPRFYQSRSREVPHFLESCFLCRKPLGQHKDIFMYRGNKPFCSEECRREQIEIDEMEDKNWNLSMKVSSRPEQKQSKTKTEKFSARTGAIVAA